MSFDGQRIVFAYADHTPPRDQWQFFLYEIHADGTGLRQLTGTQSDPLAGAGGRMTVLPEDYDPCYLPDGGIAFISTCDLVPGQNPGGDEQVFFFRRVKSDDPVLQPGAFDVLDGCCNQANGCYVELRGRADRPAKRNALD